MLRTSSFLGPINSGFVPFSSAAPSDALVDAGVTDPGTVESDALAEAAEVIARAAASAVEAVEQRQLLAWAPASSVRIRVVEGAVIAAICCYFAGGLLRTLAGC